MATFATVTLSTIHCGKCDGRNRGHVYWPIIIKISLLIDLDKIYQMAQTGTSYLF